MYVYKTKKGIPFRVPEQAFLEYRAPYGEVYARKLLEAGVRVTAVLYHGTIHDFVMLKFMTL